MSLAVTPLLVVSLLTGAPTTLDETDPGAAAVADCYRRARSALTARQLGEAQRRFTACLPLATAPEQRWTILLGLALSFAEDARWVRAVAYYRAFMADSSNAAPASKWGQRRVVVGREIARLDALLLPRFARLTVRVTPETATATVTVDGKAPDLVVPRAVPLVIYLAPGRHTLAVSRDGLQPHQETLDARAGAELNRVIALEPPPKPPDDPPLVVDKASAPPAERIGGFVAIGVGAAATIAAISLTLVTADKVAEVKRLQGEPITPQLIARDDALHDQIERLEPGYWAMYVLGAAALATGVALLVSAGASDAPSQAAGSGPAALAPWGAAGPDGAAAGIRGRF